MNGPRNPVRADTDAPRALEARLGELERALRALPSTSGPEGDLGPVDEAARALDEAAAADPAGARRLAGRLEAARTRHALCTRRVPDGALDGLYQAVRAQTVAASASEFAAQRAGMSSAFLDAPRALVLWRRAAVAACALVALGVGWMGAGGWAPRVGEPVRIPGTALAPHDPRDELLTRLGGPVVLDQGEGGVVQTVVSPARGGPLPTAVFPVRARSEAEADQLLDSVRLFPVPVAPPAEDLEKN